MISSNADAPSEGSGGASSSSSSSVASSLPFPPNALAIRIRANPLVSFPRSPPPSFSFILRTNVCLLLIIASSCSSSVSSAVVFALRPASARA